MKISREEFFRVLLTALFGAPWVAKWWPPTPVIKPPSMWDPVLISLVRKSMPNLIAYDVCGVQPMSGPSGLIFAMRNHYATNPKSDVRTRTRPQPAPRPRTRPYIPYSVARRNGWCLELHKDDIDYSL